MAVARRIAGKYRTNSVKVFYFNIEDVKNIENEVNEWLQDNDKYFDVVDIKLSECQNKTVVLIHFRKKEENNP